MSDFVKYVDLKRSPIIMLQGMISDKALPAGVIKQELKEDPPELDVPIKDLIYPGNFRPLVKTVWDLPHEAKEGEILATTQGFLFQGIKESWVMVGSAVGAR